MKKILSLLFVLTLVACGGEEEGINQSQNISDLLSGKYLQTCDSNYIDYFVFNPGFDNNGELVWVSTDMYDCQQQRCYSDKPNQYTNSGFAFRILEDSESLFSAEFQWDNSINAYYDLEVRRFEINYQSGSNSAELYSSMQKIDNDGDLENIFEEGRITTLIREINVPEASYNLNGRSGIWCPE